MAGLGAVSAMHIEDDIGGACVAGGVAQSEQRAGRHTARFAGEQVLGLSVI